MLSDQTRPEGRLILQTTCLKCYEDLIKTYYLEDISCVIWSRKGTNRLRR